MSHFPTVDYVAPGAAREFGASMHDIGFAVLRGALPDARLLTAMNAEWVEFFATADKDQHAHDAHSQVGYFAPPVPSDRTSDGGLRDNKEFFQVQSGDQTPAPMSPATATYLREALSLAVTLLEWLDGRTEAQRPKPRVPYASMILGSTGSTLRIQHYLPIERDQEPRKLRAVEHQDLNLITLLPSPTGPGLQVKTKQGDWLDIPWGGDLLIVNAGLMLECASGGHFPATPHRVSLPKDGEFAGSRLSFPLFVHPRPEVVLSGDVTAQALLRKELEALQRKGWAAAPGGVPRQP